MGFACGGALAAPCRIGCGAGFEASGAVRLMGQPCGLQAVDIADLMATLSELPAPTVDTGADGAAKVKFTGLAQTAWVNFRSLS